MKQSQGTGSNGARVGLGLVSAPGAASPRREWSPDATPQTRPRCSTRTCAEPGPQHDQLVLGAIEGVRQVGAHGESELLICKEKGP
jgi:hypothetical protein